MEEEVDLKELLSLFWKKKMIIIIVCFICIIIAFLKCILIDNITFKESNTNFYAAETSFVIGYEETSKETLVQTETNQEEQVISSGKEKISVTDSLIVTYGEILKSKTVLNSVNEELDFDVDIVKLANEIELIRTEDSDLLKLIVVYENKDQILAITNKIEEKFIEYIMSVYDVDNISVIDNAFILSDYEISSNEDIQTLINSNLPKVTDTSVILKNFAIFIFIGCIISCGYILIIEMFDDTIKTEREIKDKFKLKVLFNSNEVITNETDLSIINVKLDNFKYLVFNNYSKNCKNIALNVAKSFAKNNRKVLYIDLLDNNDACIDLFSEKGINNYIKDKEKDINKYIIKSANNNLNILFAGSKDEKIIYEENQVKDMIQSLEKNYDVIIIDAEKMTCNANSLSIVKVVKNLVLIVENRKTKYDELEKILQESKDVNASILGCIYINK